MELNISLLKEMTDHQDESQHFTHLAARVLPPRMEYTRVKEITLVEKATRTRVRKPNRPPNTVRERAPNSSASGAINTAGKKKEITISICYEFISRWSLPNEQSLFSLVFRIKENINKIRQTLSYKILKIIIVRKTTGRHQVYTWQCL